MRRTLIDGLTFAVLLYGAAFGGVLVASAAPANALRTALIDAWREHGIERTPGAQGDGGTVTAQGALNRLCWN